MDSASIRVVALGNGGTGFIEVAGLLVMEAENHSGSGTTGAMVYRNRSRKITSARDI